MKNIKIILLAMSVSVFGGKKETLDRENKTKKKELTPKKKIYEQIEEFIKAFDYKSYKNIKTYFDKFLEKYPENEENRSDIYSIFDDKIRYIKIKTNIKSLSDEEKNEICISLNNWTEEQDIKWESKDKKVYLNKFKEESLIKFNEKYKDDKYDIYINQEIKRKKKFYREHGYNNNINPTNMEQIKKLFDKYIKKNQNCIWLLYQEVNESKKKFLTRIVEEFFNKNKISEDPSSFIKIYYHSIRQKLFCKNNYSNKEINEIKSDKDIEEIDNNYIKNILDELDGKIIEKKNHSSIEEIDSNNENKSESKKSRYLHFNKKNSFINKIESYKDNNYIKNILEELDGKKIEEDISYSS